MGDSWSMSADTVDVGVACVVSLGVDRPPVEMASNLSSEAVDAFVARVDVCWYGAWAVADNIPVILSSVNFSVAGVDAASYLVIKHSVGYLDASGGASAIVDLASYECTCDYWMSLGVTFGFPEVRSMSCGAWMSFACSVW